MRRIIASLIFGAFCLAQPALAAPRPTEPQAIVADVYAHLMIEQDRPTDALLDRYNPPNDLYTPALAKAFAEEKRDAAGDLGRLDFFFWVNGQDWKLADLSISERSVWRRPDRRVVAVAFSNFGQENSLLFYFQKVGGRWLIDDVESLDVTPGDEGDAWVLSLILKYAREEE